MSDTPQGPGWWRASDGKWYPEETHPNYNKPKPAKTASQSLMTASIWIIILGVAAGVPTFLASLNILTSDDAGDWAGLGVILLLWTISLTTLFIVVGAIARGVSQLLKEIEK